MRFTVDYPVEQQSYVEDTKAHIQLVANWLREAIYLLELRRSLHDSSKLEDPELSGFMAMTADARLKDLTYGSDEYRAVLREHKPTIQHHYAENDHHPEHWDNGINDMSLLSLLEMLCDWKAATARMKDGGDIKASLEHNAKRFGISTQLQDVLVNTARELGMIE